MKISELKIRQNHNKDELTENTEDLFDYPIEGGYFKLFRKIFSLEIWLDKPPYYAKIFVWLYGKANHKKRNGINRGQLFTSIDEIRFQNSLKKYKYDQIRNALNYLKNTGLIDKQRTSRGLKITICNYDIYDDYESYISQS